MDPVKTNMRRLGEFNFLRGRVQGYFAFVAFLQTTYLSLDNLGLSMWWMLAIIPMVIVVAWVDLVHVYPSESDIGTRKNPQFVALVEKVDEVLDYLRRTP